MSEIAYAPLSHFADVVMGQSPGAELCNTEGHGLPFLQGCAEFGSRHPQSEIYCSPPLRVAKAGSVLISVRAPVGTMNYADQDYCIGRGLGSFKAKANVSNTIFLKHAVELNAAYLHRRSQGSTFAAVSTADVKTVPIPFFKPEKQEKIATILSGIDTSIEKTEALIAKYQQIKAGMMHDLFTRGVLPNGQLRQLRSEAPELYRETAIGWIPVEWQCCKLREISDLLVGFAFKSDWFQQDGVNLLRGENVGYGIPNWRDRQCLELNFFDVFAAYALSPGDIVIGMDRTFTKSGVKISKLSTDDCPALLVQRVGKFIAVSCEFSYLRWLILSSDYLRRLFNQQKGMDIPHLSKDEILEPLVPLPLREEQVLIAQRIQAQDDIIARFEVELRKLNQLKLGLMKDLLTGKVPFKVGKAEVVDG